MLTRAYVSRLLEYSPATGAFRWLVSRGSVKPGRLAGTKSIGRGRPYWMIKIDRRFYYAHKIAWLLTTGDWPAMLDHINGDSLDNRIGNLRLCTMSQNQANRKRGSNNATGAKGVHRRKENGRFRAYISFEGRRIHLGAFGTAAEAVAARSEAAQRLFGEFARLE